jgi:hypothetical protein
VTHAQSTDLAGHDKRDKTKKGDFPATCVTDQARKYYLKNILRLQFYERDSARKIFCECFYKVSASAILQGTVYWDSEISKLVFFDIQHIWTFKITYY